MLASYTNQKCVFNWATRWVAPTVSDMNDIGRGQPVADPLRIFAFAPNLSAPQLYARGFGVGVGLPTC